MNTKHRVSNVTPAYSTVNVSDRENSMLQDGCFYLKAAKVLLPGLMALSEGNGNSLQVNRI